jgi:acyl carrier protein phosphodiesterase
MLPYMVQGDWLTSYATLEGLGRALSGLARRVPEGASMIGSERVLDAHMATYVAEFKDFLPDLKQHVTPLQ